MDEERTQFSEMEFVLRNTSAITIQSLFRSHRLRYLIGLKPRINQDWQEDDIAGEIKNNLTLSEMLKLFLFVVLNLACLAISLAGTYTVWSSMAEGVNAGAEQSLSSQMIMMMFTSIAVVSGIGVLTGARGMFAWLQFYTFGMIVVICAELSFVVVMAIGTTSVSSVMQQSDAADATDLSAAIMMDIRLHYCIMHDRVKASGYFGPTSEIVAVPALSSINQTCTNYTHPVWASTNCNFTNATNCDPPTLNNCNATHCPELCIYTAAVEVGEIVYVNTTFSNGTNATDMTASEETSEDTVTSFSAQFDALCACSDEICAEAWFQERFREMLVSFIVLLLIQGILARLSWTVLQPWMMRFRKQMIAQVKRDSLPTEIHEWRVFVRNLLQADDEENDTMIVEVDEEGEAEDFTMKDKHYKEHVLGAEEKEEETMDEEARLEEEIFQILAMEVNNFTKTWYFEGTVTATVLMTMYVLAKQIPAIVMGPDVALTLRVVEVFTTVFQTLEFLLQILSTLTSPEKGAVKKYLSGPW